MLYKPGKVLLTSLLNPSELTDHIFAFFFTFIYYHFTEENVTQ